MRYSDGEIRQISMSRLGGALSGYQDSDGDGIPNNTDPDDDNDGYNDDIDAFPYNSQEWLDTDNDLIGNTNTAGRQPATIRREVDTVDSAGWFNSGAKCQ